MGGSFAIFSLGLLAIVGLTYWNTVQLISTIHWINHTNRVIEMLESLLAEIASAEAGQRGFIITGNEAHLEFYYLATAAIEEQMADLQELVQNNPVQQQRLQDLQPQIQKRLMILQDGLVARRQGGLTTAQRLISQDIGRQLSRQIRHAIGKMLAEEHRLAQARFQKAQQVAQRIMVAVLASGVFSLILVIAAGFTLKRDLIRRRQIEAQLQASEQKLQAWIDELEQRGQEIAQLGELSDVLQACFNLEEAYVALGELVQPLFPKSVGGVFTINESKTLVEAVATWGDEVLAVTLFGPSDCWALRRGRPYFLTQAKSRLHCQHLRPPFPAQSLCVPMMAQGEALGILHLTASQPEEITANQRVLAETVAEHIALAIANLKLRETLKNQSIRDPLTGLFNRRYMEESLTRELHRAERNQQTLSVIMLDVDHFKRLNDTFGHEAGDLVLQSLGQFLRSMMRSSDIACRYGGEEFMLLLPEADLEVSRQRAEQIRTGIKQIHLEYRRQPLEGITLSLGLASFPHHGNTGEAVIRAADAALYQAKHQGRDRVMVAT